MKNSLMALLLFSFNLFKYHFPLSDIQLDTPNSANQGYPMPRALYAMESSAMKATTDSLPLEASKEIISATASGKVVFE